MSKVFFISDLHFGHKYVIAFDKRPFKNVQEMEREMIRRWNAKVSPEDHVFVVGDMFGKVTTAHAGEIVHTLNGKIHLIRGNHDPKGELFESLFEEVVPSKAIQVRVRGEKQRVIMRHRLLPVFKGNDEGVVQLYGHTHGSAVADRCIPSMSAPAAWITSPRHWRRSWKRRGRSFRQYRIRKSDVFSFFKLQHVSVV